MTRNTKIAILTVLIVVGVLAINSLTDGNLPFYILGGIGLVILIGGIFYFVNQEKKKQVIVS